VDRSMPNFSRKALTVGRTQVVTSPGPFERMIISIGGCGAIWFLVLSLSVYLTQRFTEVARRYTEGILAVGMII
jgi:hypothetical protein